MWCDRCKHDTPHNNCELCGSKTEYEPTTEVHWCSNCNIPIIKMENAADKDICPLCGGEAKYFASGRKKPVSVTAENHSRLVITFDNNEKRLLVMSSFIKQGTVYSLLKECHYGYPQERN